MSYRKFTLYGGPLDGLKLAIGDSMPQGHLLVLPLVDADGVWQPSASVFGQSSAIYRRQGDRLVYAPPRRVAEALAAREETIPVG